jgi:hypothetical protein
MSSRTRIRPQVALIAAVFGIATAVGGLLTWISANGPRPSTGMAHTSLSQMLVYTYRNGSSLWASVGFAVLLLGALIVVGAVTGVRTLVGIAAVLAIAAGGMWIGLVVHHYNTPTLSNSHYLNPANLPWSDLRVGAWLTLGGAVLAFVSAFLLRQRTAKVDSLETVSVA